MRSHFLGYENLLIQPLHVVACEHLVVEENFTHGCNYVVVVVVVVVVVIVMVVAVVVMVVVGKSGSSSGSSYSL